MTRRRIGVAGWVLVALLAFPREGSARLLDLIWEMSGPQMVGLVAYCTLNLRGGVNECQIPFRNLVRNTTMTTERAWFSLEGGAYTSTWKDGQIPFSTADVSMLAFDPIFEFRARDGLRVFHGVGATFNYFVGTEFRRFGKAGFKFRPIGVNIGPRWELAYTLRVYPNRVEPGDFGVGPRPADDRPYESTHGIMLLYRF